MSIDYRAVLGVGVANSSINFEDLTEKGLLILKEWFDESHEFDVLVNKYSTSEDDEIEAHNIPKDVYMESLAEYFYEVCNEQDFLGDGLGLCAITGNLFHGYIERRGVGVNLDQDTIKDDVEFAKNIFGSVLNIEPELFIGVIVS